VPPADRYSAVLIAFAAHVQHVAVVGAADVTDVGVDELVGSQAGQQGGEDDRPVTFRPVVAA
jgi:hypothetical protein